MKYLYQQLIAFWVVIAVTFILTGFAFTQMTRHTIEQNNYQQLYGYAKAVERISKSFTNVFAEDQDQYHIVQNALNLSEAVLNQQSVTFVFINSQGEILYPSQEASVKLPITKKQWTELTKGQMQQVTLDTDIFGQKNITAYAMVPFLLNNEFGVLIVSQPAKNVEDTVGEFTSNLMKGFVISGIFAFIISYFYASFQVRRINRMKKATKEVANGNFDISLPVHDRDEFDELAADFNKMAVSLKASHEEIERQEERRKQFMADASHEMRTPLTTINGLLEGLQYHAIPENQKEKAIHLMKNETERLIRLVSENLDYEKIRTNQISMVIKKFNATEALNNILIQLETKAEQFNDQLVLTTQEKIDVYADYDRFVQIMVNIIQNAIQFTENGTISVSLEKGNLETIIRITDTGIGMTEEQQKNIWDRYYKVDPSRKNKKFGESGLGLPIVQQLVRLHKGKISVDSTLGKGTTFTIIFPDVEIVE
ncbi:MAG TPA: HAMP domain-containing histidine kinase [Enterococcus columbae]|nr:HAMP domain-containing histidine kinase [Enterococcus columbae]